MELITAIALMCQISFGVGTGDGSYSSGQAIDRAMAIISEHQESCQKRLAKCILEKDKESVGFRTSSALKCIKGE